jgi:hypothetical protein
VEHFSTVVLAPDTEPSDVGGDVVPVGFDIMPAYPNPFNPATTIPFRLAADGRVTIGIYNILGQHVATLVDGVMPAGSHSVVWNGTTDTGANVTSGVYIARLEAEHHSWTGKLLLVR